MLSLLFLLGLFAVLVLLIVGHANEWYERERRRGRRASAQAAPCAFCGAVRLDECLDLAQRERPFPNGLRMVETHLFCNDSRQCMRRALDWQHAFVGEHVA